jgi:hypothetical protein
MRRPFWTIDCETVAIEDAAVYLETPTAPANYKDPAAIARYVYEQTAKNLEKAALDIDLAQVLTLGVKYEGEIPVVYTTEVIPEKAVISQFWERYMAQSERPALVGFFNSQYDVPLLIRRAQLLGIPYPQMDLGRYRHPDVIDVAQALTFDWHPQIKAHSLDFYAKRFGIPHDDTFKGADVAQAAKDGNWGAITEHCRQDVEATHALASRLGLLE